jgi:hypothetical protein
MQGEVAKGSVRESFVAEKRKEVAAKKQYIEDNYEAEYSSNRGGVDQD